MVLNLQPCVKIIFLTQLTLVYKQTFQVLIIRPEAEGFSFIFIFYKVGFANWTYLGDATVISLLY